MGIYNLQSLLTIVEEVQGSKVTYFKSPLSQLKFFKNLRDARMRFEAKYPKLTPPSTQDWLDAFGIASEVNQR